jgi:hypothetical protein
MPSPFPGMDPYLEGPEWRSFHTELATQIGLQLVPQLRHKYIVRPEKVYILTAPDPDGTLERRVPDVSVRRSNRSGTATTPKGGTGGGTAVLEPPPLLLRFAEVEEVPQVTVNIYDVADRTLVAAIEVLSPTNKERSQGRAEYLAKRQRLFHSDAHLIEIDLLRMGPRLPMADPIPPTDYCVLVSRADRRPMTDVWPVSVRQPLPTVPVPVLPGDPEAKLDLQLAVSTVYDAWAYDDELNYVGPPPIPLSAPDAAWAADLLARRLQ